MRSVIKADHGSNRHRREGADLEMTTGLIAPAAQVCAFARGCGLTHAAAVSRALAARAIVSADRVPPGSSLAGAPDDDMSLDDITTDNGA